MSVSYASGIVLDIRNQWLAKKKTESLPLENL